MARVVRSKRKVKAVRKKRYMWGAVVVILVIAALFGFSKLLRVDSFTIQKVAIEGENKISVEEVKGLVQEHLLGSRLLLIPNNSKWFYPGQRIEHALLREHPLLLLTSLSLEDDILEVYVEEREFFALWCTSPKPDVTQSGQIPILATLEESDESDDPVGTDGSDEDLTSSGTEEMVNEVEENEEEKEEEPSVCVYVDETGFAYRDAPELTGTSLFRLLIEGNDRVPTVGTVFAEEPEFEHILRYKTILEEVDLEPISFIAKKEGEGIFQIGESVNKTIPRKALVDLDEDPEIVKSDITTSYVNRVFDEEDIYGQQKQVEYIDARIPGKLYFRFVE